MSWRAFQRFGVVFAAALVAAALRFWPLDGRSYWRDEAFTVDLVRLPFAEMLDEIPRSEGRLLATTSSPGRGHDYLARVKRACGLCLPCAGC
jgi:hypothetical protein